MNTPEDAYGAYLKKLADLQALKNTANEAQTRLQMVDVILFDVLDWHRSDVEVEKYCRAAGFADYVFILNKRFPLLIEAKKAGDTFIVAEGVDAKPRSFALLGAESPGAKGALAQALGYAAGLGCRYISVSNGHQWIIAQTFVEAQTLDERTVIVFDSLESIKENFRLFWNCFSKVGVASNSIANLLLDVRHKAAPRKLSTEIPGYPVPSHRNIYANELNYILSTLWDYLSKSEHTAVFLEHCYVPSKNAQDNIAYAREAFRLRYAADSVVFSGDVGDGLSLYQHGEGSGVEKPFVVLGKVGHGKSTFLDYLKYTCEKNELSSYIQVDVNFLDRPDFAAEVSEFVYDEIENQLLNSYNVDIQENGFVRGVLDLELKRYRKSPRYAAFANNSEKQAEDELQFINEKTSQKHTYFKSVVHHLKRGQKRSLVVFFDNLDRRDPAIQESAFLKASSIARDWECVVFVCLRPDTFHESQKRGLLDSVAPKVFAIGAVDLYLVLKKRFDYARRIADGEFDLPILRSLKEDFTASMKLPSVAELFACCEFSVRKGASAIGMLAAISNGNIRLMLDFTKRILVSNHLDTKKIIRKIKDNGGYVIPDFEAIKTLMYGDYYHYDPRSSLFINLFDIYHSDPKEHFIKILILEFLSRYDERSEGGGFVSAEDLDSYIESFYFSRRTITAHMEKLVQSELAIVERSAEATGSRQKLSITSRGSFHLFEMLKEFQYFDAMIIDTPITDSALRTKMAGQAETIEERVLRTELFFKYLRQCAAHLTDIGGVDIIGRFLDMGEIATSAVKERLPPLRPER